MSEPRASRTNINDGPIAFNDYISLNRAGLEAFFRSMLKPVNDNDSDSNGKNFIVEENFSLEPLKRLYFQDFYKSLLSTEKLYDLVKYDKFDNEWGNKKVLSNSVKIKGNTDNTTLNAAIDAVMGRMNEVEIDESHFHSTIEFTEGNRNKGLYDYGKLPTVNASGEMFQLGLLEQVFKEEEALLLEDIRRENRIISYQTIARRLTELFARLSNIRLSMLFWTDKVNNYSKQWSVAALDIFYNLLSRMSEARRLNVKLTENIPVIDILFWIDHTGSMIEVIGDVQQTVKNMALSFASTTVRVGFTMHNPGRADPLFVGTKRPSYISKDLVTRLNAWASQSEDKIKVWPVLPFTNDYSEIVNFFGGRIVAKTYNGKTKLYGLPPGGAVTWGGNEYVEGLQGVVRGEYVKGNGTKAPITEDVDVVWSDIPGSYRKVILISDEPNDNYINISRQFPLAYHSDSSKRIKLKETPYAFYGCAYKVDSNGKLNMITRRSYKLIPREDKPGFYTWEPLWEGVCGQVKIGNKWYYYKAAEFGVNSSTGPWTNTYNRGYANVESKCSIKFTYYTQTTGKVSDIVKGDVATTTISDIYFHRSAVDAGAYEQQEKYFKTNWHLGSTGHYEPKTMKPSAGYMHRIEALNPVRVTCDIWGFDMSLLQTNPSVINWKYVNAKPHDVDNSCVDHCPNHWDCCYFATAGFDYANYRIPNKNGGVSNPKTTSPENIDSFAQAFTSTHTDLYWMFWKSSDPADYHEFFSETAKYRIKEDIIKKINGHGAHAEFTELRQVDAVVEQVNKILLEAVLFSAKYYARAARLNKTYADLVRPCVFVPNLVSAMMMISQSKAEKDKTSDKTAPDWTNASKTGLLDTVIANDSGNYKWFGRTNEPRKNSGGNIIVLQDGMYGSINETQNEALSWGGDYVESLTGIHLKLIDKPTGEGWSSGSSWTDDDIKAALTKGFEILADAFTECLNDGETMKVLDMTTNPPTPTNFPELLKQRGDKKPTESGALANIGDLQCSLVLERIIAKVYQALNVSGCSYFIGKVPKLNMDFALRFLTDQTISDKNELTSYRKTYSDVVEYAKRASAWNGERNRFDADTVYTLDNVVTKTDSGTRVLNPSFAYLREDWSLCPYRFNRDKGQGMPSGIAETAVGRDNDYGVHYSEIAPTCPFAETVAPEAGHEGDPPCDRPHGCSLHTFYEVSSESEKNALLAKLNGVPSVCPCVALVNGIRAQLNESPERIPYENGSQYIHALFKNIQNGKPADTRQEEEKSMGYKSSALIYEHVTYPGETPPSPEEKPPTYKDEVHSSVRLVYIDHLIRLCQDLFMVNMDIAFEEPYLKTKVEQAERHYYGSADYGSFEPVSCYRFSNFHALNDKDERSAAAGTYRLKYFARTVGNQWVTAVNRDLSGETSRSNSIWSRSETLDNERKVPGTTKLESQSCYPYYFSYANRGSYPYMGSSEEILSGIIDPEKTRSMDICRSNHTHPFYQIHLMDELASVVSDGNKATSLATFEVYVKRFRPIFLPNANDLFVSHDRDPLNPSDNSKSLPVNGWSLIPHKYSADAHFSKDAIIIPTNFGSRNSPRGDWFHELDYAFHKAVFQDSDKKIVLCGFYDESLDGTVNIDSVNLVGKELEDFAKYRCRDWMYPASMLAHCHTSGDNGALATITTAVQEIINADTNPADGANDWTQGAKDNIVITKEGNQTKLYVSKSNLNRFDQFKCIDSRVGQTTALSANWLYITTHGAGGGVEASQCMYPLPWVFFHSSRGDKGYKKTPNWYHGLGDRVTTNHETSFNDGQPNGMRFFAVDAVLSQNPVKMKLFGRSDTEVNAKANIFSKGFYDPSCCGTKETWHTHGSAYYGWANGSNNKDGPRPDKYYLPYDSNGRNHVTGGTSLTSSVASGQYYSYISGSVKTAPFADKNDTIVRTLKGKPMTWSLWNVIRHSLYWCYNVRDLDYDPNRIGCTVDRKTMGASNEEIEFKTGQSIRAMYKEWYHRFTYNGYYTQDSRSGCSASTAWPYKVNPDDPSNYLNAQRLMNGAGTSIAGTGPCKIEWTNLVADMSIIYNEVSDTHNSCLTMYTGGHPNYSSGYTDGASQEFRGPHGGNDSGIWVSERPSIPSSWALTGAVPNSSNSRPFRYALSGVDMCRNFMALTYRGYNSPIPDKAYGGGGVPKFQPHSSHPKELRVSREIRTINCGGNPPTILTRSTYSTDGTEFTNNNVLLNDIYPPSEHNDTEGCDSNFLQRLLLPIYPNWEDLHDSNGVPLYPDSVSDDDMKKIVFCVAPITYYNGLADGNDDGEQMGERMMAFCITQFFMGEDAEKMTSVLDTEFFSGIAQPNVSVVAPTLGHDYKPGDPAWGQGLVTAGNWKPEKWNRQS